jgi:acyl-CoA thioester hydrolase
MTERHAARFTQSFDILDADIDELGHVNNVVYVRWIQEIAGNHWRHAAPAALQEEVVWVVVRHEIDYERPALPGDAIVAVTWVGAYRAARWARHTEIRRAADDAVLVRATSIWCPLRAASGRPRRIDETLQAPFYT